MCCTQGPAVLFIFTFWLLPRLVVRSLGQSSSLYFSSRAESKKKKEKKKKKKDQVQVIILIFFMVFDPSTDSKGEYSSEPGLCRLQYIGTLKHYQPSHDIIVTSTSATSVTTITTQSFVSPVVSCKQSQADPNQFSGCEDRHQRLASKGIGKIDPPVQTVIMQIPLLWFFPILLMSLYIHHCFVANCIFIVGLRQLFSFSLLWIFPLLLKAVFP